MTYTQISQPSSFSGIVSGFGKPVRDILHTISRAIEVNSTSHRRLALVHSLQARSDAELEALGIERDQIVHHVFKDVFYV